MSEQLKKPGAAAKLWIILLIVGICGMGLFWSITGTKKTALSRTQVSQLYVTLFGRASEGAGNAFWRNAESLPQAATAMLASQAAKEYFGAKLEKNRDFVEIIYKNALNKSYAQDPEGINFWTAALDKGTSRGEVVAALIHAIYQYANSNDPAAKAAYQRFVNRVAVSDYCSTHIAASRLNTTDKANMDIFRSVLSNVTNEPNSVTAAKRICDQAATK